MAKEFIASPTPELVIEVVASNFHLPPSRLRGRKRDETTSLARQVAMYLIRQNTDYSLADIGREVGGRSPATVGHSYQKIAKRMSNNSALKVRILDLQEQILKDPKGEMTRLIKKRLTPDGLINEIETRSFQRVALVIMPIDDWKAITDAYHSSLVERITGNLLQIFLERAVETKELSFMAFAREFG